MYQVTFNKLNGKKYYAYHLTDENETFGDLNTTILPPLSNSLKSCAYYWSDNKWELDEERYSDILKEVEEHVNMISTVKSKNDIDNLKTIIARQQEEINELKKLLT